MKKNFAVSLMNKIHKQGISQRERFYFVVEGILKIVVLIVFLLVGMLAMAMVMHLAHNIAFLGFVLDQPRVLMKVLWVGVPLFWLGMTVILWYVIEKLVQQTDRGYRIPMSWIATAVLVLQVAGGLALEQSSVGESADQMFESRADWYHGAERINRRFEASPEMGFLAGTVMEIKSDEVILLNDVTETEWTVHLMPRDVRKPKMEVGKDIRLIGKMLGENEFLAEDWKPAGRHPLFERKNGQEKGGPIRPPLPGHSKLREITQ